MSDNTSRLVYFDDVRIALSVGFVARQHVILWGKGGHAKSMGVDEVWETWRDGGARASKQVLSIGTNPLDLVGGGDPESFKNYIFDRPRVEDSWFAQSDVHCLEEMLDMPPRTGAYMKDMISARLWRYGEVEVPMRCRLIVGCTNHDPAEIAKTDDSVAALLERFPIQVRVMWPHYTADDFEQMFRALADGSIDRRRKGNKFEVPDWDAIRHLKPLSMDDDSTAMISEYMGLAAELGAYISPRTAVYGALMVGAYAALVGADSIEDSHLDILRLCVGLNEKHGDIMKRMEYKSAYIRDRKLLEEYRMTSEELLQELAASADNNDSTLAVDAAKRARGYKVKVTSRQWCDDVVDAAMNLKDRMAQIESDALVIAGLKGGKTVLVAYGGATVAEEASNE